MRFGSPYAKKRDGCRGDCQYSFVSGYFITNRGILHVINCACRQDYRIGHRDGKQEGPFGIRAVLEGWNGK